jgi:hypothetical protein
MQPVMPLFHCITTITTYSVDPVSAIGRHGLWTTMDVHMAGVWHNWNIHMQEIRNWNLEIAFLQNISAICVDVASSFQKVCLGVGHIY